jgi:hypothetical protein
MDIEIEKKVQVLGEEPYIVWCISDDCDFFDLDKGVCGWSDENDRKLYIDSGECDGYTGPRP